MKVVITGKTGILSQELQKLFPDIITLDSYNYNITDSNIYEKISLINPDIIIHAGAVTNSIEIKNNPLLAIKTNIIGTANIAMYCVQYNKRLVYISTDYIYEGIIGNYKETDSVLPYNEYAWTKLGGECSVKLVSNHLIIRTSFGTNIFPYSHAWTNQIVSKDYVDIIAPMILKASKSNTTGILNIGTNSKTIFEYASKRNNVLPKEKSNANDFSLNTDKYEQLFTN
jgi:dTDP-4-dehydrorhamnose reductase